MSEDLSARNQGHHDVFISYAHEDKPIADAVCAKLESRNIRCWIAPRDVPPGKSFPEAIIEGIDGGKVIVVIFSSHANNSPHVIRELTNAVNKGRIVIPFRIEDVIPSKSMEYLISVPHWLDAVTPPLENHIEVLIHTIDCILSSDKTPAACLAQATTMAVQPEVVAPTPPASTLPVSEPVTMQTDIPKSPAIVPKRRVKTLLIIGIILVALIAIVLGFQGGLISLPALIPGSDLQDSAGTIHPTPSKSIDYRSSDAMVNTAVLTTEPTQTLAKDTELFVEVNKDSSTAMVTVQFAGGPGTGRMKENRVILTRSDGTVTEGTLNFSQRLSEVQLQGTRGTDRLQVIVTTNSGETKSVVDMLLPYRQYH